MINGGDTSSDTGPVTRGVVVNAAADLTAPPDPEQTQRNTLALEAQGRVQMQEGQPIDIQTIGAIMSGDMNKLGGVASTLISTGQSRGYEISDDGNDGGILSMILGKEAGYLQLILNADSSGPVQIPQSMLANFADMAANMLLQNPAMADNFKTPDNAAMIEGVQAMIQQAHQKTGNEKTEALQSIHQQIATFLTEDPNSPLPAMAAGVIAEGQRLMDQFGLGDLLKQAVNTLNDIAPSVMASIGLDNIGMSA